MLVVPDLNRQCLLTIVHVQVRSYARQSHILDVVGNGGVAEEDDDDGISEAQDQGEFFVPLLLAAPQHPAKIL